jgi:hypothetical protein
MNSTRILLSILVCVAVLAPFARTRADNYYYFQPETLRVYRHTMMEWHLMMECDVELCGYGFSGLAPEEDVELFDPDDVMPNWSGTAAELYLGWPIYQFDPASNVYEGAATSIICPPSVPAGNHIAIRLFGAISDTAPFGIWTFSKDPNGYTDFTDAGGSTFEVELGPGYLEVIEHLLFLDLVGCPNDSIPEAVTTEVTGTGICSADNHLGTMGISCDVPWPDWAAWEGGDWDRPATGTLTLCPPSDVGPWMGNFIFDFYDLGTGEHAYDTCYVHVWNSVEVPQFTRGDADRDSDVQMSDAVATLKHLYVPGGDTLLCIDAGDSDDDGEVLMGDAVYTLKYLYVPGQPAPPLPFPNCGQDPTPDALGCGLHPCMGTR